MALRRLIGQRFARTVPAVLLFTIACATPVADLPFHSQSEKTKRVFVVKSGWHAAIVLATADISERVVPEMRDFPGADYLEIGWGDWDYYQAPDPGLGLALKAAFFSSASVLHVFGFSGSIEKVFPESEIIELVLAGDAFGRLTEFISGTFSRPHATRADARPGLDSRSRFYRAEGKFHLFRTCNTWVAEALRSAGVPVSSSVVTAGGLMHEVQRFGVKIGR